MLSYPALVRDVLNRELTYTDLSDAMGRLAWIIMAIPPDYHVIFGLAPDFGGKPFSMVHYASVVSCHTINQPRQINCYYRYEPQGPWWDLAKPYLNLVRIDPPQSIFGIPILRPEHMADVVRLQLLLDRGGIYLDLDVLCLRPFEPLLGNQVVLGEELNCGVCNAVILSAPGAPFLRRWIETYRTFSSGEWNTHSVIVPGRLVRRFPREAHILDHHKFFWPLYGTKEFDAFVGGGEYTSAADAYCVHLWETATWKEYLEPLSRSEIWRRDSELCRILRRYVPPAL